MLIKDNVRNSIVYLVTKHRKDGEKMSGMHSKQRWAHRLVKKKVS